MRQAPSFSKSARPNRRASNHERRIIEGGPPECMACRDNGTIEIHPALIGENSPRGVRRDLIEGNLSLCDCSQGDFWREVIEPFPSARDG